MTERDLLEKVLDELTPKHLHWVYVTAKTLRDNQPTAAQAQKEATKEWPNMTANGMRTS